MKTSAQLRRDAETIWRAGVDAVAPGRLLGRFVQREDQTLRLADQCFRLDSLSSLTVIGAGKAAAAMARAFESILSYSAVPLPPLRGWIHVLEEQADPNRMPFPLIPVRPAGHPSPTEAGVLATRRMRALCEELGPNDLGVCLLSGGASAMMPLPAEELTLAEKQSVISALSRSGATITEINTVRKHLSRIKGGQLAASCRAGALVTFVLSDVIGNPLDVIGSGPTVPDPTTFQDAVAILERYALWKEIPAPARHHLEMGVEGKIPDTPKSLPSAFHARVIGDNSTAREAAASTATQLGYEMIHWPTPIEGEAREVGRLFARWALQIKAQHPTHPICLIAGGEPVVSRIAANGKGGRCQELVLGALTQVAGQCLEGLCLLAAGTDGEDGPTDAAGAFLDEEVQRKAFSRRLSPEPFLTASRSYDFCRQTGAHFHTGPTGTNVMDLVVLLVAPAFSER